MCFYMAFYGIPEYVLSYQLFRRTLLLLMLGAVLLTSLVANHCPLFLTVLMFLLYDWFPDRSAAEALFSHHSGPHLLSLNSLKERTQV